MVKIEITKEDGEVMRLETDTIYGCAMVRTEKDGQTGVHCDSFLAGGGISVANMGEPMGASVTLVLHEACAGNEELEYAVLGMAHEQIMKRGQELMAIFSERLQEGGQTCQE